MEIKKDFKEALEKEADERYAKDFENSIEQEGGYYYELFKFFSDEHNLTLLDTEIQDIIHAVKAFEIIKTTFTKNEKD